MFEEFYEMYESEEQEVVALINRCIGGGYNNRGNFWQMTVVTLGMVFCDTGKVTTKEERLEWPVTDEERNSVPFPVSWTVKMKKKQKETQDILSYHTQAAGCSDKARAKASGGRQPIEECGRTGL